MNLPDIDTHHRIDALTHSSYCFALYRLPWTDDCCGVFQTSGTVEELDDIACLNDKKGFVIAPFSHSKEHPLVLIRPDLTTYGWNDIRKTTLSFMENDVLSEEKHRFTNADTPTDALNNYKEVFQEFISPLKKKEFQKLVLSRTADYPLTDNFSPLEAFVKACNIYPRMLIYLFHTPATGTWIGSTPEILLSGEGKKWNTVALAGTMPMQGEVMPTEWTTKNKEEQAFVADYVRRIVNKHSGKLEEKGPYTARAGQLVHLKTDFYFQLKRTDTLGNLLKELHPTPAVCGLPKEEAYQFISKHEKHERKYYSGFIGWLNPQGQTDIYVNLRCMEIHKQKATLYAGGGILPSSDVTLEWEETNEKMKTMKNIL